MRAFRRRPARRSWSSRRSADRRGPAEGACSTTGRTKRPRVVGKLDENGAPLLPSDGELTPAMDRAASSRALRRLGASQPARWSSAWRSSRRRPAGRSGTRAPRQLQRTPYFCSGCPHNTSTKVPEGSRAMAGIGCHVHGDLDGPPTPQTFTHMGGEGVPWIGQAPFTERTAHLRRISATAPTTIPASWRSARRSRPGVNITYKILYNDAVAMTGGQPVDGGLTVAQIARQVAAEGVKTIASSPTSRTSIRASYFAGRRRRSIIATSSTPCSASCARSTGLTVLIYDQTCAAEKRRRRKRGHVSRSGEARVHQRARLRRLRRLRRQSNCVSVQPVETEFGRKRRIDQSSCNKDYSCVKGFCPSFVTVEGGKLRKADARRPTVGAVRRSAGAGAAALDASRTTSWSPASAAPASSPSARCSAWPRISRARAARARHDRAGAEERRGHDPRAHRADGRTISPRVRIAAGERQARARLRHRGRHRRSRR